MAEEKPRVSLYDFLYKDVTKISSFYAQLFKGNLLQIERIVSEKSSDSSSIKGDIKIIGGEKKSIEELIESKKETVDPHDMATTDVLAYFVENDYIKDFTEAKNGDLVLVKGSINFIDKNILEMALVSIDFFNKSISSFIPAKDGRQKSQIQNLFKMVKDILSKAPFNSLYLLNSNDILISGTIKEQYLDEPISSYYFKHGSSNLPDIYLLGIKEVSSEESNFSNESLMGFSQTMSKTINQFIFTSETIKVTPLAIFRKF